MLKKGETTTAQNTRSDNSCERRQTFDFSWASRFASVALAAFKIISLQQLNAYRRFEIEIECFSRSVARCSMFSMHTMINHISFSCFAINFCMYCRNSMLLNHSFLSFPSEKRT